jgi:hypothetical protein
MHSATFREVRSSPSRVQSPLVVGDDITLDPHSEIIAALDIDIFGDANMADGVMSAVDPDPGRGTDMVLRGSIIANAVLVTAGSQAGGNPVGVAKSRVTSGPTHTTEIWGNNDVDTLQFGDYVRQDWRHYSR